MTTVILTVLLSTTEYAYTQEGQMSALRIHVGMVKFTHRIVAVPLGMLESVLKLLVLRMEQSFPSSALGLIAGETPVM